MAADDWKYERGDIISAIGEPKKFLVIGHASQFGRDRNYVVAECVEGKDCLSMKTDWIDREWCESKCVKVGLYDFENDKEFEEDE